MKVFDAEYAIAVATIITDRAVTDMVRTVRLKGIQRLVGVLEHYADRGFREDLLEKIWARKIPFILSATAKKTVDDILKPSAPIYNGGIFCTRAPYHSEAEELILWSLTSLNGPLIHEGFRRYKVLFTKFFPEHSDAI
jgi:hypothetical protein